MFNILDTPDEVDEGKTELDIPNMSGNVDFSHINFSYVKGKQVIKDFNLEVKQGQKIALVGATGSG